MAPKGGADRLRRGECSQPVGSSLELYCGGTQKARNAGRVDSSDSAAEEQVIVTTTAPNRTRNDADVRLLLADRDLDMNTTVVRHAHP